MWICANCSRGGWVSVNWITGLLFLSFNMHMSMFFSLTNPPYLALFFISSVPIPRNSGALLCGMKGMAESVTDILSRAGVFEGRILTNF